MEAIAQIRVAPRNRAKRSRSRGAEGVTSLRGSGRLQYLLDPLGCGSLVDLLHCGELADEPVERGLIDLALAVGLLGLAGIAMEVAHHFGDRSGIARVDLRFVFLGAT